MDKKLLFLSGLLKRVGNLNLNTFEGRVIFQKTIYFMQVFGINFGYSFNWYIYGPYSPELTKDGYRLKEEKILEKVPKLKFVNPELEDKFNKFLDFISKKKSAKWLELLASIHFLVQLLTKKGKNEIMKIILKKQTHFTKEDFEEAWGYLKKEGLI